MGTTLILWLCGAGLFLAGMWTNKKACNWLHARAPSPLRDKLLVILNGGPGPVVVKK